VGLGTAGDPARAAQLVPLDTEEELYADVFSHSPVVAAQPGGGRFGGGGFDVSTLVLTNAPLQEELKVTDAQKEKFKPVADKQTELGKKMRDAFSGGKFDKDAMAELREEGKKVSEEAKKVLDTTLNADQKKRLKQIGVQMLGVNAFAEPSEEKGGKGGFGFGQSEAQKATMKEVADALKLSDSQKSKIKDILSEHTKDVGAIRKDIFGEGKGAFGKGADPEKLKDFQTKSAKVNEETMSKISELLDATQKKTWKELTGDAFDTSKLLQPRTQPKKD
jgi:hypothetical protein